jgi:quinohemoprotein ethanol dehydrogenase
VVFPAQAAVLAAPITYSVSGRQYLTVLVGNGTSAAIDTRGQGGITYDDRTQKKRILTFTVGGKAQLSPPVPPFNLKSQPNPDYKPDPVLAAKGADIYNLRCFACHGSKSMAGGFAPDLRASPVPASQDVFDVVVHGGTLLQNGMPRFDPPNAGRSSGDAPVSAQPCL